MFLFNNCLLVYFNGDPPTARPPPPPPPLLPRGGLDGEEAGGGTSHSPLPPGTAVAAGPRAGGGRAGRAAARRGPGAATAPGRCRSAERGAAWLRAPPAGTMAAASLAACAALPGASSSSAPEPGRKGKGKTKSFALGERDFGCGPSLPVLGGTSLPGGTGAVSPLTAFSGPYSRKQGSEAGGYSLISFLCLREKKKKRHTC